MKKHHSILFQMGGVLALGASEVVLADLSIPLRNGTPDPKRFLSGFYGHKGKRTGLADIYEFGATKHPNNPVVIAEACVTLKRGIILGVLKETDVIDGRTNFINLARMSSQLSKIVYDIWDDCSGMSKRSPQNVAPTNVVAYFPKNPKCVEKIFHAFENLIAIAYPAITVYGEHPVQMLSVDRTRSGGITATSYNREVKIIA